MDTFVPPGWMPRTELVKRTGKALFKDKWLGAVLTTVELLQANPELRAMLVPDRRDAVRRASGGYPAKPHVVSQELFKLLDAQKAEEPMKTDMHNQVVAALREPLSSGVIPSVVMTPEGSIVDIPPQFWQGDRATRAFDTEEATAYSGRTYMPGVFKQVDTGRVLFKRAEAEAWLRNLDATPTTIAAETRAKEWFQADVKRGEKRYTRSGYCEEMVRQFGISERGARRIWDAAAPDPWKKPGSPKKL